MNFLVQKTRVLTPKEARLIRDHLTTNHKVFFDGLLFTGMRETEFEQFVQHPEWVDWERNNIILPSEAVRKARVRVKRRVIPLSNWGQQAIERVFDVKVKMPQRNWWRLVLIDAAKASGIDKNGITPKMTRKTWESWLIASLPKEAIYHVLLAMGHTAQVSVGHYLQIGFSREEIDQMKQYTDGWLR
jgi:integrase